MKMTNCTGTGLSKSIDASDASSVNTKIEPPEVHNVQFERVPSLWFEDGNVIIVAQASGFRVHKGVLSRHSAAFVKLLDDSNDSQALTDYLDIVIYTDNGIVIVHVSDSPHDIGHLLRIFYDGFDYLRHTRPDDFADLAAAARLAHKYTVPVVLSEATIRLQELFPPTFDIWESTGDVRAAAERVRPRDAIEAVNLFRALGSADGAHHMLPVALYLCCQLSPGELLRGHRRADGMLERLAIDDIELCWKLQQTLADETAAIVEQLCGGSPWLAYVDEKKCKCFKSLDNSVLWRWFTEGQGSDPLGRMLRDKINWAKRKFNACDTCLSTLRKREKGLRVALWNELHCDYAHNED